MSYIQGVRCDHHVPYYLADKHNADHKSSVNGEDEKHVYIDTVAYLPYIRKRAIFRSSRLVPDERCQVHLIYIVNETKRVCSALESTCLL